MNINKGPVNIIRGVNSCQLGLDSKRLGLTTAREIVDATLQGVGEDEFLSC